MVYADSNHIWRVVAGMVYLEFNSDYSVRLQYLIHDTVENFDTIYGTQ